MEECEVGREIDLKAAGAELLPDGRRGLRLKGWLIESFNRPILTSLAVQEWEEKLGTSHLPEMVFGDSSLCLLHVDGGVRIHFNAFDALKGWKQEALPPVEVPAAEKWKFRSKLFQQVTLDYDYTFTTPYCGSEAPERNDEKFTSEKACPNFRWEDCDELIDLGALSAKEPILFYDEVILYEDELADNGVSLLTVKVRVMPSCWFLLLRFWLRVDGVLMRLRDTRMYCAFGVDKSKPVVLRESCWREATFKGLSAKGYPSDSAAYGDPDLISKRLPIIKHKTQKLKIFDVISGKIVCLRSTNSLQLCMPASLNFYILQEIKINDGRNGGAEKGEKVDCYRFQLEQEIPLYPAAIQNMTDGEGFSFLVPVCIVGYVLN